MTNDAALKAWEKFYAEIDKENWLFVGTINPEMVSLAIKALEERPQGEWIAREDMDYLDENKAVHNHFECNKCGFVHDFIDGHTSQYNFCPKCGADMRNPNCVRCDHFGKCEGCEKGEEE